MFRRGNNSHVKSGATHAPFVEPKEKSKPQTWRPAEDLMTRLSTNRIKDKDIADARSKMLRAIKHEEMKTGAAKLCGGVKSHSRANVIGFGEELVHKSGSDKKINLKARNKTVEFANRRVGFKAKENHNSSGAVRGGSALVYTRTDVKHSVRSNTMAVNHIYGK